MPGMLLHNFGGRSAVCKDKVEEYSHTERVCLLDKVFQILICAVLGVYVHIIANAVWVARVVEVSTNLLWTPLTLIHIGVRLTNRNQIDYTYAQILESLQLLLCALQSSLLAEVAKNELITKTLAEPRWRLSCFEMGVRCLSKRCDAHHQRRSQYYNSFHKVNFVFNYLL